jgi:hypothetical protein
MFYPIRGDMFALDSKIEISEVNMLVVSRGALMVATASMATCILAGPGVAYADDTSTPLTAAEMSAALQAVSAASSQAAAQGWKGTVKLTGDEGTGNEFFAVDPVAGVALDRFAVDGRTFTEYVVAGKGTYADIADPTYLAALKMMHRPSVRYVFTADKSVTLDEDAGFDGMSPATLLADPVDRPGTKTVHDDGATDYRLDQDGTTMTVHVSAAGVLTSADGGDGGNTFHVTFTYAYGPQHVTLPAASVTIGSAALAQGVAYLDMATSVKQVAGEAATDTLRAAHGHKISVSSLRKVAHRDATAFDDDLGVKMVKAKNVRGGVRVYATNPWTHRTVAYTLQPSGKKVTIGKK